MINFSPKILIFINICSAEVYEKSEFKQKSVDGSVYSDIKPKTGEVSSLGEIVNSEISIKQELKNVNIFTEVSNKKWIY